MAERLPDVITTIKPVELLTALVDGWRALWAETPKRESVLVLAAQSALETARWKSCHCYNLGNAKGVSADGRDWTFFVCNEVLAKAQAERLASLSKPRTDVPSKRDAVITSYTGTGSAILWCYPDNPVARFRAFRSLHEGAIDYLGMLRKRFGAAWPAVEAGDPRAFVQAIKAQGYFTASEKPYENSVASIFAEFSRLPFVVEPTTIAVDEETRQRLLALITLTSTEMLGDNPGRPDVEDPSEEKTDPQSPNALHPSKPPPEA